MKKLGEFREKIPKVKPGQKTKFQDDLVMLNELLQVRHSFSFLVEVEWFSIECCKTKTKVIQYFSQSEQTPKNQRISQNSKQIQLAGARGKTRASKSRLVLVLPLIG